MDDVSPLEPAEASTQADTSAPALAPVGAETITAEGDARSSPVQTTEKKDKDKEKEKEHKEHITIEVCQMSREALLNQMGAHRHSS
jgi:DNA polymerase epsilon subunit 3